MFKYWRKDSLSVTPKFRFHTKHSVEDNQVGLMQRTRLNCAVVPKGKVDGLMVPLSTQGKASRRVSYCIDNFCYYFLRTFFACDLTCSFFLPWKIIFEEFVLRNSSYLFGVTCKQEHKSVPVCLWRISLILSKEIVFPSCIKAQFTMQKCIPSVCNDSREAIKSSKSISELNKWNLVTTSFM